MLSALDQLTYSTIRIVCKLKNGASSTGTAFIFRLEYPSSISIPVIITNKHVIAGAEEGTFKFTKSDVNDLPLVGQTVDAHFKSNFENTWAPHPDPNVDLCAMPLIYALNSVIQPNQKVFVKWFDESLIPTTQQLSDLDVVEEILMIGYPNGIWDSYNNKPVVRRGITATDIGFDYNGKEEFLIDAACFPGSSGSPVIIYNKGSYSLRSGETMMGSHRLHLLGILYAGPQHQIVGQLNVPFIIGTQPALAISSIPNNLGVVIKAERIMDFKTVIKP